MSQTTSPTTTIHGSVTAEIISTSTQTPLAQGRGHHTATLLTDGRVLIAGGAVDSNSIDDAERYDPVTNTTEPTAHMIAARAFHTASVLPDGSVLLIGGTNDFRTLRTTERYDPTTDMFAPAANLNSGRWLHTATTLQNGDILVAGGVGASGPLASVERWTTDDTFQQDGSLAEARYGHTATLLPDGTVLVVGGTDGTRELASAELYDPTTRRFTPTGSLTEARSDHTATLLPDGDVLIAGGTGANLVAEVYDHTNGTFRRVDDLKVARAGHSAILTPEGKVLLVGGNDPNGVLDSAEVYEPATGTFSMTARLREARFGHTTTLLPDGSALIVGSEDRPASVERVVFDRGNTFSGTLIVPTGWITATTVLTFTGSTSDAPLDAATLDDGMWQTATADQLLTGHIGVENDGIGHRLTLRMRDTNGTIADVVATSVMVDALAPSTRMFALPPRSDHTVTLSWKGFDTISGLQAYDIEVRDGLDAPWTPLATGITATSTTFEGEPNHMYFFRMRAWDRAGNAEAWPLNPEAQTLIDPAPIATWAGDRVVEEHVAFATVGAQPRLGHTATRLADNTVLVTGGSTSRQAQRYDPGTDQFSNAGIMRRVRIGHTATRLLDGTVLLAGGNSATAERYDPATQTFAAVGSMHIARTDHSATLLTSGLVLIVGGTDGTGTTDEAEVFDPATNTFTPVGALAHPRAFHTATRLADGRVLIAGGTDGTRTLATAEVYDPTTQTFRSTANLRKPRNGHTATLLRDGTVLLLGGSDDYRTLSSAERYDPATNTFALIGSMAGRRYDHTATMLANGMVLVAGGSADNRALASTELYDPATNMFRASDALLQPHTGHLLVALDDGLLLVVGGTTDQMRPAGAERGTFVPANTLRGTLTVSSGWLNAAAVVTITGATTRSALAAATIDGSIWHEIDAERPITVTVPALPDGRDRLLELALRDRRGVATEVVTASLNIDTTSPTSAFEPLPATSPPTITLRWTADDATSGVSGVDIDVNDGTGWMPLVRNATALSTTFVGEANYTYTYTFRLRARDNADNVEAWNERTVDTAVDATAPTGAFEINGGALATTTRRVFVAINAEDGQSSIARLRLDNGDGWQPWQTYSPTATIKLSDADGVQIVSAQIEDSAGNVSATFTQTIRLDRTTTFDSFIELANGAIWTNAVTVTARIGAPSATADMQISTRDNFDGATWQSFDTSATTLLATDAPLTEPRTIFIRTRDVSGTISLARDTIIYDPVAPTGTVHIQSMSASSVELLLIADDPDDLSGVARMRVSFDPFFRDTTWVPYSRFITLPRPSTSSHMYVFAQFEDGAGNQSATTCGSSDGLPCGVPSPMLYLPLIHR